ncbi:MAG: IS982 family transposase, partial [Mediterranea sp.]|nr:IS982 family transposase [Mediterranea sp.]
MFTRDKITEIFCIADDFCKEFSLEVKKHQLEGRIAERSYYRPSRMSESEIITILIYFHLEGYRNFKHFYLFYVCEHLQDEFPNPVS